MADAAGRLTKLAEEVLGVPLPVRIRAWDRSESARRGHPHSSSAIAGRCAG